MRLLSRFRNDLKPPTVESVARAINQATDPASVLYSHDPDPQLGSNPLGGLNPTEYLKVLQRVNLEILKDTDDKEAFLDILRDTAFCVLKSDHENAPQLWGDVISVMEAYAAKHGLVQPSHLEPDQKISAVDITVHGAAHRISEIMYELKKTVRADCSKERLDGMGVMAINALAKICKGDIPDYFANFKGQHLPGYALPGKQDILLQITKCAVGEKSAKAAIDVIVDLIETGQIREQDADIGLLCLDLLSVGYPDYRDYVSEQLKRLLKNEAISGATALNAMQYLAEAKIQAVKREHDTVKEEEIIAGFFRDIISPQHDQGVRLPDTDHVLSVRISKGKDLGPIIAHNFEVYTQRALYGAAKIIHELESEIGIPYKLSEAFEAWTSEQIAKARTAALTFSL